MKSTSSKLKTAAVTQAAPVLTKAERFARGLEHLSYQLTADVEDAKTLKAKFIADLEKGDATYRITWNATELVKAEFKASFAFGVLEDAKRKGEQLSVTLASHVASLGEAILRNRFIESSTSPMSNAVAMAKHEAACHTQERYAGVVRHFVNVAAQS
jgi:hypothetical protein